MKSFRYFADFLSARWIYRDIVATFSLLIMIALGIAVVRWGTALILPISCGADTDGSYVYGFSDWQYLSRVVSAYLFFRPHG